MLQVMIKVSGAATAIVYSLEVYQNNRFVRLLKARSATELVNAVVQPRSVGSPIAQPEWRSCQTENSSWAVMAAAPNDRANGLGKEGSDMSATKNGKAEQDTGHRTLQGSELL